MSSQVSSTADKSIKAVWSEGLASEAGFWDKWIETKGSRWKEDFERRMDPQAPFADNLCSLIAAPEGARVRVLDVGAGPLTRLGKKWGGRSIEIVAIDPLADEYNASLDKAGIIPLVRTRRGEGERLSEYFPESSFDLTYAVNCLDHAADPYEAIRQMLLVVKPGGFAQLEHATNEAERQKYHGLHQWNFSEEGGRFIISRPGTRIDVQEQLGDMVSEARVNAKENWISVGLRKR